MRKEKAAKDAEARRKEEEEQMGKLDGRMQQMIMQLQSSSTPFEYTLSGVELGSTRSAILASNIAYNNSLLSLHICRKRLSDTDGQRIAQLLLTNTSLRKLELEGNQLGPKSASDFGKALKVNKTLKFLNLESNQLTVDGQDMWGIYEFVEFLDHNTSLLSLNLANNQLDEKCGSMFRESIERNQTLIDFDFSLNNFNIQDSRDIQEFLRRNKAAYDAARKEEWLERKEMRYEDEQIKAM
jgi:hypothetical protein